LDKSPLWTHVNKERENAWLLLAHGRVLGVLRARAVEIRRVRATATLHQPTFECDDVLRALVAPCIEISSAGRSHKPLSRHCAAARAIHKVLGNLDTADAAGRRLSLTAAALRITAALYDTSSSTPKEALLARSRAKQGKAERHAMVEK
jgi:hypothetical protein